MRYIDTTDDAAPAPVFTTGTSGTHVFRCPCKPPGATEPTSMYINRGGGGRFNGARVERCTDFRELKRLGTGKLQALQYNNPKRSVDRTNGERFAPDAFALNSLRGACRARTVKAGGTQECEHVNTQ